MFIINNKGDIFNTNCIPEITTSGDQVVAVFGNTLRSISHNSEDMTTIADGIRNGAPFVEVN